MTIIKTKTGTFTLAILMILSGVLLDSSGAFVAQALHHMAFILGGVAIGFGIKK